MTESKPPPDLETISTIAARLKMSAEASLFGDQGQRANCVVNTYDLMMLLVALDRAAEKLGPWFKDQRMAVTKERV